MAEPRYVSFKWLLGTVIGALIIVCGVFAFFIDRIDGKVSKLDYERDKAVIEKKVDASVYQVEIKNLCNNIDAIKSTVESNERTLNEVVKTQQRVLERLKMLSDGSQR